MKNKEKKIVYYNSLLEDDFAKNITKHYKVSDDFKYIHKNIFYRFFSFLLYHFIAIPFFFIYLKIRYHLKVYNRKATRKLKNTGYFIYGNHSQNIMDAVIPQANLFLRKGHIIANNDVYSLKLVVLAVNMLGCLPTPNNMIQSKNLFDAITYYINKKDKILIYPEAHVWPYYNDIRPFLDTSFIFPSVLKKPIIVTTIVYRERKILKNKPPYLSLYVSEPIYPKEGVSVKENQMYLRDEAYNFMKKMVTEHKSYEYIIYKKKEH